MNSGQTVSGAPENTEAEGNPRPAPPEIFQRKRGIDGTAKYLAKHHDDPPFKRLSFENKVFMVHFTTVYDLKKWQYTSISQDVMKEKKFDMFQDWYKLCNALTENCKAWAVIGMSLHSNICCFIYSRNIGGLVHFANEITLPDEEWFSQLPADFWKQKRSATIRDDGPPPSPITYREVVEVENDTTDLIQLPSIQSHADPDADFVGTFAKKRKLTSHGSDGSSIPQSWPMQHITTAPPDIPSDAVRLSIATLKELIILGKYISEGVQESRYKQQEGLGQSEVTRAVTLHLPRKIGDMVLECIVSSDCGEFLMRAKSDITSLRAALEDWLFGAMIESYHVRDYGWASAVRIERLQTGDCWARIKLNPLRREIFGIYAA